MSWLFERRGFAVIVRCAILVAIGAAVAGAQWRWFDHRHELADSQLDEAKPDPARTSVLRGRVQKDVTLADALREAGLDSDATNDVMTALAEAKLDFRRRKPGEPFGARVDNEGRVVRFAMALDQLTTIRLNRNDAGRLIGETIKLPTETQSIVFTGTIKSSFYQSIIDGGEQPKLAGNVVRVFEYDIDFAEELREGDTYRILLDRITCNGRVVDYGRIHAAEYVGQVTGTVRGYWLDHENREIEGYYNEKGVKLKKFFLRAPLDVLRVTSRYGVRFHPTLRERRMHTGVDYGAPTGTRVWAVADGTVSRAGSAGGYGKLVEITHPGGLRSRYAHLSAINVRGGQRVGQRQVIGRVGSTGRSTGPHLHFELLSGGRHINPAKQKIQSVTTLPAALMPKLKETIAAANERMEKTEVLAAK
ncbi:MAG: M23 family metallopeptidase [Deltaproteobacteria bacterium]|nr:M23 family metallopeptidase [Deltaproteobacteria bacterium]